MAEDWTLMNKASEIFSANMRRYGFSFSPLGIYRAAFDENGALHRNWELKMRQHQPTVAEHPALFEPPKYIGERRKMN